MLQCHPKLPNLVYCMTQTGRFQSCDLGTLMTDPLVYQIDTMDYCNSFDISTTGDFLCFTDASGGVHLWSNKEEPRVNLFSHPLEMVSPLPPPAPVKIGDETPLSVIGLPYYDEPLLSNWTHQTGNAPASKVPPPIPLEVLATMKIIDGVGYARNPGFIKRNQQYARRQSDAKEFPKFRSEQERENSTRRANSATPTSDRRRSGTKKDVDLLGISIPKSYRKVEIKYSRFGVEDFDFG